MSKIIHKKLGISLALKQSEDILWVILSVLLIMIKVKQKIT